MLVRNIQGLCKEQGLNVAALERELGFGNATIRRWDDNPPTITRVERVADYFGVSVDHLLGRETNTPSPAESALLKSYRSLDASGRAMVDAIMQHELSRLAEINAAHSIPRLIPLPRSIQPASAGRGTYLGAEDMRVVYVEDTPETRRAAFIVPVSGDSMEPLYHDGDQLLVERADDIEIGEVGVFTVGGDGYVKRRGEDKLISINPAFPDVPLTDDSWCNGRVIGTIRPEAIK